MQSGRAFDVSAALERHGLKNFRRWLIILSCLVTFFDGFDMNVIAFLTDSLTSTFHLTPQMMGNVFSSGIFGTLLGGFLFGYIGDRIGRRPAIIGAVGGFGLLTLALAFSNSYETLLIIRFFDGLALGGVLPLIWALNIEYAPKNGRATVVTIIMLGYGFGVTVAGPIARLILPTFGWPGVFVFGAILSMVAAGLLLMGLPESLRYLAARGDKHHAIKGLLGRIGITVPPTASPDEPLRFMVTDVEEEGAQGSNFRVSMLFAGKLKWLTPLLWFSYFASSISTFFIASWGPKILEDLGFSANHAAYVTALNSLCAAAGGLAIMRFTDKHGPISISVLPLTAVPLLLFAGLAPINLLGFILILVPISIFLGGSHYGVVSILGNFYPSAIRANGAGWCSGVGKIGSVMGPLIGGYLLAYFGATHLPVRLTYALLAICPAAYGLAILGVGVIYRGSLPGAPAWVKRVANGRVGS